MHLVFDSTRKEASRKPVSEDLFAEPSKWSQLKASMLEDRPDGMILVHRLAEGATAETYGDDLEGVSGSSNGSAYASSGAGLTDWWGVVVSGRSARRHSCYLLKTTRVGSTGGGCTRFSLTRARCFGAALHQQMEESWLA